MKSVKKIFICAISAVFTILTLASCSKSPIDKSLDELDAFVKEAETIVEQYQNNEISHYELGKEMTAWGKKVGKWDTSDDFSINDLNSRQKKRYSEIAKRLENLDKIADEINNSYYY